MGKLPSPTLVRAGIGIVLRENPEKEQKKRVGVHRSLRSELVYKQRSMLLREGKSSSNQPSKNCPQTQGLQPPSTRLGHSGWLAMKAGSSHKIQVHHTRFWFSGVLSHPKSQLSPLSQDPSYRTSRPILRHHSESPARQVSTEGHSILAYLQETDGDPPLSPGNAQMLSFSGDQLVDFPLRKETC